ncbi:DivIVA domain-containing protein [Geodermatophilus ruber]|uniref:Cell wall synthesis protein Wag31 n=1 Tax=Geodermatophilus ruber TaxID=504800 RepID=A0A1I4G444_9ACTN|nr:DivIVA domain-containing protein [Geodermatophilus ruber]SFL24443.1 DivIVA domain-containing protein [Geodermatophilus ruber]
MTSHEHGPVQGERRLAPADVRNVQFTRGTMLRPGYSEDEVDRFLLWMADELAHLHADKAELRDQVRALQAQVADASAVEPPSEQAVRILATAQQTADSYVAEAEDFSRQMTTDARAQYEEQLRRARDNAGAIIAAAQEAAAKLVAGGQPAPDAAERPTTQELEDQVAYLKAFAQACRVQLRAYLEALLTDVETEWGRADPGSLPQPPLRAPAQRSTADAASSALNVAREVPLDDSTGSSGVITPRG